MLDDCRTSWSCKIFAATTDRSFAISAPIKIPHCAFRGLVWMMFRGVEAFKEDWNRAIWSRKSVRGRWQVAIKCVRFSAGDVPALSLKCIVPRWVRILWREPNSCTTSWNSDDAPPLSFRAFLTFVISPITAMKSPTPNPNGTGIFRHQSQLRKTLRQRNYWQVADFTRRATSCRKNMKTTAEPAKDT